MTSDEDAILEEYGKFFDWGVRCERKHLLVLRVFSKVVSDHLLLHSTDGSRAMKYQRREMVKVGKFIMANKKIAKYI